MDGIEVGPQKLWLPPAYETCLYVLIVQYLIRGHIKIFNPYIIENLFDKFTSSNHLRTFLIESIHCFKLKNN